MNFNRLFSFISNILRRVFLKACVLLQLKVSTSISWALSKSENCVPYPAIVVSNSIS